MNGATGTRTRQSVKAFSANCVAIPTEWGKTLVGDRANGKIYEMTGTTDDGDDIARVLVTDEIDRGYPDANGNFVQRSI
jgi:hypothetical protein